jgi:hypothetical protein
MTGQANDIQWYIARDGKQHGPLTDIELRTFIAHNYLRQTDLIWRPGMTEWQAAPGVFADAFQGEAQQSAPEVQPVRTAAASAYASPQTPRPAQNTTYATDFEAGGGRLDNPLVKRLAIASVALTLIGGGTFALATYHEPLMGMISGSSSSASTDQAPVVAADSDTKVADADPAAAPSATADVATTSDATPAAPTDAAANAGANDVIPTAPPPDTSPQPEQQQPPASTPTTTASVSPTAAPDGAAATPPAAQVAAIDPQPPASSSQPAVDGSELDARLQKIPVWELLKKEYPDWYATEITTANKMAADKKPDSDVAMLLAQGLVNLRRQNADKALAASSEKLQAIAEAFLQHLKALRAQSVSACFGFISKGETSPAVVQMMEHPETATALNAQAGAIFEAISEGAKNPVKHDSAVKSDYDVLIKELAKLGWKEEDLQVFSNPKLLAKREPQQVCKMVQEWFVAHLAVQDAAVRDRLLYETLKPVVSG